MNEHILIIGAGAAGLMAAKELSAKNYRVTVLEARDRIGGRIHTEYDFPSNAAYELGAEFVHGNLPVTLKLLKEAGISLHEMTGEMWHASGGDVEEDDQYIEHQKLFNRRLKELKEDQTIDEFLQQHFSEEKYAGLRASVRGFASGYDTADPAKASAIALRDEWQGEQDEPQYRVGGGYQQLIDYLARTCTQHGGEIITNAVVKEISWTKDPVIIKTASGGSYSAAKVIVTVPLNVLKASAAEYGAINFSPALPAIQRAAGQMEMGAIIKILLLFKDTFWTCTEMAETTGRNLEEMGFMFSGEQVPTWWTQYPGKTPLLTGWLGGPKAEKLKDAADGDILAMAVESLANIFKTTPENIQQRLTTSRIINWTADPFSRGSYSYATVATKEARAVMSAPIEDTIYFAGEALYDGPEMGTVEAALSNGMQVAHKITRL